MPQGQTPRLSPQRNPDSNHAISADAIREELQRVLASHEFRATKRSQDFLRYVVENTLDGHADILKERTIGIDVFARPTSYDPSDDATVRVKAGDVRKRLGLYYAGEGRTDEVRIDLPAGGYIPGFMWVQPEALDREAPVVAEAPPDLARPWAFGKWPALILAVAVLGGGAAWLRFRQTSTVLDEFWSPVLQGNSPALLCAAYVPVYTDRETGREHPQ